MISRVFCLCVGENKAYLSRCENGRQRIAFSKLIALSRIYEVPPEVLVERMELDLELDRIGSPDTAGLNFVELRAQSHQVVGRVVLSTLGMIQSILSLYKRGIRSISLVSTLFVIYSAQHFQVLLFDRP